MESLSTPDEEGTFTPAASKGFKNSSFFSISVKEVGKVTKAGEEVATHQVRQT